MGLNAELDGRVADLLAGGDLSGAAAEVVRSLGPDLCGYLCAILRSEEEGREVFAQTCERLLVAIGRFRGESAVKTWAYRIAWRSAMRWRRDGARRRLRRLESRERSALAQEVRDSTAAYQKTAAKHWLTEARQQLSPADQSILILRLDRDMSWNEVAAVMGQEGTPAEVARLRKRYERVKDRLRMMAERDGLIES